MATTFCTNVTLKALHTGLASSSTTQLDTARSAAYCRIVTALQEGGYTVSTFTAAPTAFGFLTMLEARIAAADLLCGGSGGPKGKAGGRNWEQWVAQSDTMLAKLARGAMAILNDSTGELVAAPKASRPGLMYEQRNAGPDLGPETEWKETDKLETW